MEELHTDSIDGGGSLHIPLGVERCTDFLAPPTTPQPFGTTPTLLHTFSMVLCPTLPFFAKRHLACTTFETCLTSTTFLMRTRSLIRRFLTQCAPTPSFYLSRALLPTNQAMPPVLLNQYMRSTHREIFRGELLSSGILQRVIDEFLKALLDQIECEIDLHISMKQSTPGNPKQYPHIDECSIQ
jgi:hypothetical protein